MSLKVRGTPAARVVAAGLVAVALAIAVLAALAFVEFDREGRLHRDVIARLESIDVGDTLRGNLVDLGHATRIAALTDTEESHRRVEQLAEDIETGLVQVGERPLADIPEATQWKDFVQSARLAVMHARSVVSLRKARGRTAADAAALEVEQVAVQSAATLDALLDAEAAQINRRSLAQIRVGDTLRIYVAVSLVLAMALLATIFALYRAAVRRERAAIARIEHMAHYDTVTGLPNRALLADRLAQEVARAHRGERPFAVLLFDLDGFKEVNDTWGHAAGDRALQIVADRCRELMRASDTVGRLGGDEFLVLLPETTLEGAHHVAEKLRASLAEPYPLGDAIGRMTASVGLAMFPAHGSEPETLQRAADAALYEAKREGKDRVKVASRAPARAAA